MSFFRYLPIRLAIGVLGLVSLPLSAEEDEPKKEVGGELQAADQRASVLGEKIWLHDQAAWHGTDALFEVISPVDHPELRGYLTEEAADGRVDLIFYAELDGRNFEFARITVDGSVVVAGGRHESPTDHPLSPELEAKVSAREVAIEQATKDRVSLCSRANPNLVVLDRDADGITSVYLLSAPTSMERYPLGGHYLYRIGPEGEVVSQRGFMKTCLDVPMAGAASGDKVPVAFAVTHILDDHPTEIHYFVQRYVDMTLMVMAGGHTWSVD